MDYVAFSNSKRVRLCREEYVKDTAAASDMNNRLLAEPHTPVRRRHVVLVVLLVTDHYLCVRHSQFGIGNQTNYTYTERKGGKGSNEVMSMLMMRLEDRHDQDISLTVYADNCGWQNNNKFVIV